MKRRDSRSAGYTGGLFNIQAVSFPGYTAESIFRVLDTKPYNTIEFNWHTMCMKIRGSTCGELKFYYSPIHRRIGKKKRKKKCTPIVEILGLKFPFFSEAFFFFGGGRVRHRAPSSEEHHHESLLYSIETPLRVCA